MFEKIKNINFVKRIRKTILYSHLRQLLPMPDLGYVDDRAKLDEGEPVLIQWPSDILKPVFGIIQDDDHYPKWTKYRRLLENNAFDYELYPIQYHNWIEEAEKFDIILGVPSNAFFILNEMRRKYEVLETHLGKVCYPSAALLRLYEDKFLEAHISQIAGFPFAKTYISHDKKDALKLIESIEYPFVSKIVPSSGSYGVELVRNNKQARQIVNHTFSVRGRKTHLLSYRQKNFIYFQEFLPNDGYDIRVIVVGDWFFGSYRQVPPNDFRASGMKLETRRDIPQEAMDIARIVNQTIKSPVLAVDMVHSLNGKYQIIEYSPYFQMDTPKEYCQNGIPGVMIYQKDGSYRFQEGQYWIAELALKEFLENHYLPKIKKTQ